MVRLEGLKVKNFDIDDILPWYMINSGGFDLFFVQVLKSKNP